jgi:predicted nucleic acid-binding protein
MLIVADTSPINYLILLNHDALLPRFYEQVVIPPAVHGELQHPQTPPVVRAWVAHPPSWFEVRQPQQCLEATQFPLLGAGEREAIALAQNCKCRCCSWMTLKDGRKRHGGRYGPRVLWEYWNKPR